MRHRAHRVRVPPFVIVHRPLQVLRRILSGRGRGLPRLLRVHLDMVMLELIGVCLSMKLGTT